MREHKHFKFIRLILDYLNYYKLSDGQKDFLKFKEYDVLIYKMFSELQDIKDSLNKESKNHKFYAFRHYLNFFEYLMLIEQVKVHKMCLFDWQAEKAYWDKKSIPYRYCRVGNYFICIISKSLHLRKYFRLAFLTVLCTDTTLEFTDDYLEAFDDIADLTCKYFKKELLDWHTKDEIASVDWKILVNKGAGGEM